MPQASKAAVDLNCLLGVPTETSIKISIVFNNQAPENFYISYGTESNNYSKTTETVVSPQIYVPTVISLAGLTKDTRYFYQVVCNGSEEQ